MRLPFRRSLATRVTALTTCAVGVAIIALSIGLYFVVSRQISHSLDKSLLTRAHTAAIDKDVLNDLRGGTLVPTWALGAAGLRAAFLQPDGRVLVPDTIGGGFPEPSKAELAVLRDEQTTSLRTADLNGTSYRVAAVKVVGTQTVLLLAESLDDEDAILDRVLVVTIGFAAVGILLVGLAAGLASASGLRPIKRLSADLEVIARTEDLSPIPVLGEDEVARLSVSFNQLLAALSASRDRQRQLVADASHELRTPLTSLRTNVDLLAQAGGSLPDAQRDDLLADLRAQAEEMTALIGDLVELARDEPRTPVIDTVDIADLLDGALDRVRRRAPRLTWAVESEPWWVMGDLSGLQRAITNLLDNAAKWSPPTGTVSVRLTHGTLTVDDEGPGIPEAELGQIFERFYRSSEARSMVGSGLGLAIVRQVAERQGGSVTAERSPAGGARLVLRLPGSGAPPSA
ncbi:two-component sensor histidine kinase [Nocardioides baekrokdamisoli]|uniref:histidine kinase n=1 Tax=Nocardioides baekrokdamisoli TaxID=1804624 RepID=A0A3G9J254_9ACTN|nr:HAMP domain-containing sensor histidine kinase [Nocardioides baekrokdamisoli]BBH17648.1 two-component sensor histidine kinase [Nocardioides baekrokdamisoli]